MSAGARRSEQQGRGPQGTRFFEVRRFASIASTNGYLMAQGRAGVPEGLVVVADYQQEGRGRLDRRWIASPGSSVLLSILLRPPLGFSKFHLLGSSAALAARRACAEVAGVDLELKWPNDLLMSGRKIGGVLVELEMRSSSPPVSIDFAVVGIGLNVACPIYPRAAFVDQLDLATVGWLEQETVGAVDRGQLVSELLIAYEELYALTCSSKARLVEEEYEIYCATLGRTVLVRTMKGELRGIATAIDEDGRLLVKTEDGSVQAIAVGDVVHLR